MYQQGRSDKRSAIRHTKMPCHLLSTFYVVEWLTSAVCSQDLILQISMTNTLASIKKDNV